MWILEERNRDRGICTFNRQHDNTWKIYINRGTAVSLLRSLFLSLLSLLLFNESVYAFTR